MPVPLVVIESPYRETVRPVRRYVRQLRREHPGDVISIVIPEYVVEHWWQNLLHNQTALRLKSAAAASSRPSTVTSVPWVLGAPPTSVARASCGAIVRAMSISARIERVRARTCSTSRSRRERAPAAASAAAASSPGWRSPLLGLPLLTLALDAARRRAVARGRRCCSTCSRVVVVALVGGIAVALADRRRRRAADQLLLRRAACTRSTSRTPTRLVALVVFVVVAAVVSGAVELATRRARAAEQAQRAGRDAVGARRRRPRRAARRCTRVLERAREHLRHGVGRAEGARARQRRVDRRRQRGLGAARAARRRCASTCRSGRDLRLVGRGPALFAEDQRVLHAFAARRADRLRGPPARPSRRRQAASAGERRPPAHGAARGGRARPAHAAGRHQGGGQHAAPDGRRVVRRSERDELLATIEESADRLDGGRRQPARREPPAGRRAQRPGASRSRSTRSSAPRCSRCPARGGHVTRRRARGPAARPRRPRPARARAGQPARQRAAPRRRDGPVEVRAFAGAESAKLEIVDHGPGVPARAARAALRAVPAPRRPQHQAASASACPSRAASSRRWAARWSPTRRAGGGLTMRLRLPLAAAAIAAR